MIIAMILGALGLVSGLSALLYSIHVAVVYDTFNKNVKAWSESLDESTNAAINRSAYMILKKLDDSITENKNDLNDLKDEEQCFD